MRVVSTIFGAGRLGRGVGVGVGEGDGAGGFSLAMARRRRFWAISIFFCSRWRRSVGWAWRIL